MKEAQDHQDSGEGDMRVGIVASAFNHHWMLTSTWAHHHNILWVYTQQDMHISLVTMATISKITIIMTIE